VKKKCRLPKKTEKVFQAACTLVSFQSVNPVNDGLKTQNVTKKAAYTPIPRLLPVL
ncbi:hypothetical protein, partial [Neisseria meningitidis serogroup B]